jgi:hypothetical protein
MAAPDGGPAATAPAVLALTMTADIVCTLALTLAAVDAGPFPAALLPRTPDAALNAAASLFDLLLASLLRTLGATLCQLWAGGRGGGRAAAAALHALVALWLVAKGGLLLWVTGGQGLGGAMRVGKAVVLRLPVLIGAEAAGLLFSG